MESGPARIWLWMGLVLLLAASIGSASQAAQPEIALGQGPVVVIRVATSINPGVADFIAQTLATAHERDARVVVIELDTPGGLLASARRIVEDLLNTPVPVIVYVTPSGASAASAGMFITIAANLAAMAPGTTIGAAHPLSLGLGPESATEAQKIENYTASFARSIARRRGRNQDWVEQAVRSSVALGDDQALRQHVVDLVAVNLGDLLRAADGRVVEINGRQQTLTLAGARVERLRMTVKQDLLDVLSDPNLVYLLLIGGLLALYLEFAHPGLFAPGIAGTISLLLALAGLAVLPINFTGLLLMLLGIGLLTSEAFTPAHGALVVGGLVAFVLGSLFLINTAQSDIVVSRAIIAGSGAALAAVVLLMGWALAQRRRPAQTGKEGLVGEIGRISEPVAPGRPGWIFIHGEMWRAASEQALERGAAAQVVAVDGMVLNVRAASPSAPPSV